MIADEVVERVRHAADIVQVIGEYVPLKRVGTDWRGPCPFHQGTNPNFSVSPKRGSYHCFVCHEGGDVIGFLRKKLGLDFVGAVKLLGEKVGIEVVDTPTRAAAPDPDEPAREVLAAAAAWFHAQLADAAGAPAREYLASRGLGDDAITRFELGVSPRDGEALVRHLATLGFAQERLLEAGLLVEREGEAAPRARFRGRLMFPITDERGRVVGFGARALGDAQPKYLNSPESRVYRKRRLLYGYHEARHAARRAQRIVVVEGYLDVIRLALAGVDEVVAPLGTALTEEQAALVARVAPEVFLAYDADEAGQKATFRAAHELLRHGVAVRVLSMPPGEDPDSWVRAHGREGFERLVHDAVDVFERQVDLLTRRGWFADIAHRRRAFDKLLPTIRVTADEMTRELYVTRLAEALGVDRGLVAREAERGPAHAPPSPGAGGTTGGSEGPPAWDGPPPSDAEHAPGAPGDDARSAGRGGRREGGGGRGPGRRGDDEPRGPWAEAEAFRRRGAKRPTGPAWRVEKAPPRVDASEQPIERDLVRLMLQHRGLVERFAERQGPDAFRHEGYRALYAALLRHESDVPLETVLADEPPALVALADALGGEPADALDFGLTLERMERRTVRERMDALKQAIAELAGDAQREAIRELEALARSLHAPLPSAGAPRKPKEA